MLAKKIKRKRDALWKNQESVIQYEPSSHPETKHQIPKKGETAEVNHGT